MNFTRNDTFVAKGVAVILLLIHHLFYTTDYDFSSFLIGRSDWVNLAKIGKVCVAMFLILSGYGLAKSFEKYQTSSFSFVKQHLLKLYAGFWMIFALSLIPLCFSYKGKTFEGVWGGGIQFIEDFLGIRLWFGEFGYNPTWWFLSLIIPLYIIVPILYKFVRKYPYEMLFVSYFIFLIGGYTNKIPIFNLLKAWAFPFVLGIFTANKNLFACIKENSLQKKFLLLLITLGMCAWRLKSVKTYEAGATLIFDGLTAFSIILSGYVCLNDKRSTYRVLAFIGKHSMNIFLMHTFVFGIYFYNFSYALKYPPLILAQLLLECLIFSVVLEKLKTLCKKAFVRGKDKLSPHIRAKPVDLEMSRCSENPTEA